MITIKDSNEFENVISNLENSYIRIIDILNRQNATMERVNDTDVWSGLTQSTVCTKYEQLSNNYQTISNSFTTYLNFLRQTINDYKTLENKIDSDIQNNSESLDVNS